MNPGPRVWMHGASAGDVLALMPTVRALRKLRRDVQITISTTTNTGRTMAERYRNELTSVIYQPYDIPLAVDRAVNRLSPDVLVLEYTELWPQLIYAAHRHRSRLVLHNGRFSPKRLNRYRWLFWLTGDLLQIFSALLMRDETAAESARLLGANEKTLAVTGNTKFDNLVSRPDPDKLQQLREALPLPEKCTLIVAGSVHDSEIEPVIEIYARLRSRFQRLRLLIAPRYLDRVEKIEQASRKSGLTHARRSSAPVAPVEVLILDTIGELATAYALGDMAFVGGSFTARGGQNILEPAVHGKPVVFGPHMENFADSVTLLLGRGGVQVSNVYQLERVLTELLQRPDYCRELGTMGRQMVHNVSGAAQKNAEAIAKLLPPVEA